MWFTASGRLSAAQQHRWSPARLRKEWPGVKIVFRGDSGFCRWRMLRWCDKHRVGYIVGLAKNKRINALAADQMTQAENQFNATGIKQRVFGETSYAAHSWDRPRRVIMKSEHGPQGRNPRYVVTNLPGDPQRLYDRDYCARGDMENRIKEQQLDMFSDRTSCHNWWPNQLRLLLSSLAYILMEALRR
ncbi:MAG: transposase, partial [Halieaceae bacterium]|nr:transposase [Halieaceae bacterium]